MSEEDQMVMSKGNNSLTHSIEYLLSTSGMPGPVPAAGMENKNVEGLGKME